MLPGSGEKSASAAEDARLLLNNVVPAELVTVRFRKSACSPEYSRKPTEPVPYVESVSVVSGLLSSETVSVEPETVVLTVCQVPAANEAGSATLPIEE